MNTPVRLPIAKLLKEKRFDKSIDARWFYDSEYLKCNLSLKGAIKWTPKEEDSYPAPTIAEVVMWLYEKRGIWIYTRPFSSGYFHGYIVDNSGEMKEAINTINFNSPTEAYEAAIEYTLKNLVP